ncbi:tumor necrosis factor receptor superfamily member 5 isoform X2 [Zootoca vivipara]|uniref:tumor necrosis factor receptor superfamily member 5 isoform X2 n=1 Tax=Zootoca vivipara TaxID=8524 RepID=UPI00293BAEA2|nr:tumor necrosis factor receptor superfamily member 5 isoform X2 [Zootoca vivipara]
MRWRLVPWTAVWGGCAFLACLALDPQGPSCSATEYLEGGRCCQKCGPGTKVKALCSKSSETQCVACEAQHFQAGWTKEKHCTPQAYCDKNAGFLVFTEGDATRNVVCRCRNGTHCSSPECLTCRVNRVCPAGEGVQREASHLNDTVCVACPPGSFSNISSATARCQPWSSCVDRKTVRVANGTHISDVVCGVCPGCPGGGGVSCGSFPAPSHRCPADTAPPGRSQKDPHTAGSSPGGPLWAAGGGPVPLLPPPSASPGSLEASPESARGPL